MECEEINYFENDDTVLSYGYVEKTEITSTALKLKCRFFNYFLLVEDELIYIGFSKSIYHRMMQHKRDYNFDKILLVEFTSERSARNTEKRMIKLFKPPYNKQYLN